MKRYETELRTHNASSGYYDRDQENPAACRMHMQARGMVLAQGGYHACARHGASTKAAMLPTLFCYFDFLY
jgi:hypothetical protein